MEEEEEELETKIQTKKKKRSFEDELFSKNFLDERMEIETINNFVKLPQVSASQELLARIKNISFEVNNDEETRPILRKIKLSESVKKITKIFVYIIFRQIK